MKKILILGASYGSLLGAKLALAGHAVTLVCLPAEVEAFNRDGARVRLPIKGREGLVEIDTRKAPGKLDAAGPGAVDPKNYDLIALAMQRWNLHRRVAINLIGVLGTRPDRLVGGFLLVEQLLAVLLIYGYFRLEFFK